MPGLAGRRATGMARAGSGSATMRCCSLSKSMRTGLGGVLAAAAPSPPRPPRPPPPPPPAAPASAGRLCAGLLFVALGRERRGHVVGQHHQVDAAGHLVLVAGHIEAAGGGAVVGAGGEVEILAVAVECRIAAHRSCHRSPACSARSPATRSRWRGSGWAGTWHRRSTWSRRDQVKSMPRSLM